MVYRAPYGISTRWFGSEISQRTRSWNFRVLPTAWKVFYVLRGRITAMHWRFKTVDPTLIRHSSFSFGPLAALQPLLVRFSVVLSAIILLLLQLFVSLATASYGTIRGLKDSLLASAIPLLCYLGSVCDSLYLSLFPREWFFLQCSVAYAVCWLCVIC